MTHEYVIALHGNVGSAAAGRGPSAATAVAWAADSVLAVGSDDVVRAISRGDSTFLDLGGCIVTALPADVQRADALVRQTVSDARADVELEELLMQAGLLDPNSVVEPGSPANLAFWEIDQARRDHLGGHAALSRSYATAPSPRVTSTGAPSRPLPDDPCGRVRAGEARGPDQAIGRAILVLLEAPLPRRLH